MTITAREKFECAEREVKQRRHVYGRLVDNGKMTPLFAQRRIDLMEAIAADYRVLADAEDTAGRLL